MKIVTFYSYKGGTGRSLSLVNTAYALNQLLGQSVGLVDLDLEAAALHELLGVDPGPANLLSLLLPRARNVANIESNVVSVPVPNRSGPGMYLLPCATDSKIIDEIRWDTGVEIFLREEIFPAFSSIFNLDYILIDSRSGLSEFATFALRVSDFVVLVCRADRQNRFGIGKMITVCRASGKPFTTLMSGCPSPERNRDKIESFSASIGGGLDFVLPFVEDLYFSEEISFLASPAGELASGYGQLARFIHTELRER